MKKKSTSKPGDDDEMPEFDFSKATPARKWSNNLKVIKTVRLDLDVLGWLETEGRKNGMGYQTFLNWTLRQCMTGQNNLEARVKKLEEAVFRKK
ncbi:MAG: hypothetical protein HUU37_05865 [Bdellovibrionales bacterium]|nr:hypothetical protein [Bdellovibrionales bacterium]